MPIRGLLAPPVAPTAPVDLGAYDFQLLRTGYDPFILNSVEGIEVQLGVQGLDGAPTDFGEDTPAGWDGARVNEITAEPLEVFLPLLLTGVDLMSLRDVKQSLVAYLNPRLGPVTLRVGLPDGTARLIDGYYRAMPGSMDDSSWWVDRQMFGVVIRCGVPFFRSEVDWDVVWKQSSGRRPLLPILPLAPASSQILGGSNPVTVGGDIPTYPVWKITGPLESCTIADVGTGKSFTFTATVASGDTWIIDTRRGQQAVYAPDGTRQRSTLNAGAQLWPLQPNLSEIETTVTGATSGAQVEGTAPVLWIAA